jgi:hypothetical protein
MDLLWHELRDHVLWHFWQHAFQTHFLYIHKTGPAHVFDGVAGSTMARRQQQRSEDHQTLLRALLNLKLAARRQRERDSVSAAEQLEHAVAAAEYRDLFHGSAHHHRCG